MPNMTRDQIGIGISGFILCYCCLLNLIVLFRQYKNTMQILRDLNLFDVFIAITETGNFCETNPLNGHDGLYFQAMINEVVDWNTANPRQRIAAVTPYRWTRNDDGSGRDFCIGCRANLVADLKAAAAMQKKWDQSNCKSSSSSPPNSTPSPTSSLSFCSGKANGLYCQNTSTLVRCTNRS